MIFTTIGFVALMSATGFFYAGRLAAMIHTDLKMSARPKAPPARDVATGHIVQRTFREWIVMVWRRFFPEYEPRDMTIQPTPKHIDYDAAEAALFRAVPTAWWLDPTRWGDPVPPKKLDMPYMLGRTKVKSVPVLTDHGRMAPRCLHCGGDNVNVKINTNESSYGEATALCHDCGCYWEIVPKGKTGWRQKKGTQIEHSFVKNSAELSSVPSRHVTVDEAYPKLPCGCPHSTTLTRYGPLKNGTTFVRCVRCEKWWEPPSNSRDARKIGQGECVHDKDEMAPDAEQAWKRSPTPHGVCPSAVCQFPVDKRDGMYYCTSTQCERHYEGWK